MSMHTMIQKTLSATVLILLWAGSALAQGTVMPVPRQTWLTNNGAPAASYRLCTFEAGTSTLANTYTTAALNVANANPLVLDSAGRGTVFLTPGSSYKFILKDTTTTTCVPDTGSTIWSVDNVQSVPGSASAVDVSGTAGESIAAGDAVFLSNGTGGLTTGQWYKTDADLTYKSVYASMIGMAPNAVVSGAVGSFRISGAVTTTGLSAGAAYFAGATAGAVVTTPPTNAIRLGQAASATVMIVGDVAAPVAPRGPPCGRLTLTSGTPVTTSDVTAATTLYYTPYGGCNTVSTYDGVQWNQTAFAQVSIAVPASTSQMYDVFLYDNSGVLALELTAWTNDTTRATALTTQNGVYVKTGALTRLYLGSFRTTGVSGQTEDSLAKRYVWNYYQRVRRPVRVLEATATWTYTGGSTLRQANASTANQVDVVVGVQEVVVDLTLAASGVESTTGNLTVIVAIGEDSATTAVSGQTVTSGWGISGTNVGHVFAKLAKYPAVGRHFYAWLESSGQGGNSTWYSDSATVSHLKSGITGWIEG